MSQNIRMLQLSQIDDAKYQCIGAGCSPSIIISVSNLRDCQFACLTDVNCRTLTFIQFTSHCELFVDIPSQYGNMLTQAGAVTMIATDNRLPSAPIQINTTTFAIPPSNPTATTTPTTSKTATAVPTATTAITTATITATATIITTPTAATAITTAAIITTTTTTTATITTVSNMFLSETSYSTGVSPVGVAIVDVNNDNKLDMIVANSGSNNIRILLNAGNVTFFSQTTYSTDFSPCGIAVVDANRNNKPDIVVANNGANNVGVLLNLGDGTFLNQTTYATDSGPATVVVMDVNNDNNPDIVVTIYGSNNVGILLNAGNGTFLSQTAYSTGSASNPYGVAVADVNNDTKVDIVVANPGSDTVGVLFNAGNGKFLNQTTYSTDFGAYSYGLAVVDVNNDSKPDIVVANPGSDNVGFLSNAGNGIFLNQITYSTGEGSVPVSVAIIDVINDTKVDIVVANGGSDCVGVLLNAGDGTFLSPSTYSTGNNTGPFEVAVADLNGDHKPDIVTTNSNTGNLAVLLHS